MTDLAALADRVVPVLLFLVFITVVAEICDLVGLFDEAAHLAARVARGRTFVLWLLVVVLACVCTILLSLDTTAVLLTPVAIAVAGQVGVSPLPFAMTTLWLANTASLLLPVSNLTNLLALHRFDALGLSVTDYLSLMWAPALTAIVLTVALVWLLHRRELRGRYEKPGRPEPHDRLLVVVAAVVAAALGPAFVAGITPAWPAGIAAVVLVAVTAWRSPALLRRVSVPWKAAVGVAVLFVVVDLALGFGLGPWLTSVVGSGNGPAELLRLSGIGALTSNGINNLPAYLALEGTADSSPVRLAALLVGVNAGPIVTVWGSLATILWAQRCRSAGLTVSVSRLAVTGLLVAVVVVTGATLALSASA
ncbi:SLC13 family permease [Terracoccus luteus]|uniref:Arsenical pump membrane protein n=1 Tax=Terracoccus luteus TaxID=53356 RepID=A0A839PND7_9MICO|nr:SLC13 family permease [Terracoccus luteus]MBB2985017.1 arsenical pump membrane protein [Terracoccus luteus]MCP2170669.1 arsenical pump membrane protein [Terracoccus luteus]